MTNKASMTAQTNQNVSINHSPSNFSVGNVYALLAGASAALASVFGKLSLQSEDSILHRWVWLKQSKCD
jgi:hypothetical protein